MRLAALGYVKVKSLDTAWVRVEPDAGKLHVQVCAGGHLVTGVPNARYVMAALLT